MHPNLSSLLPVADIDVGWSFGANTLPLEEGDDAEHRTGSPLTFATMTDAIKQSGHFSSKILDRLFGARISRLRVWG
jgi:hypothetical protein